MTETLSDKQFTLIAALQMLVAAAPWDFEDGCPACKKERGAGHTPTCLLWACMEFAAAVVKRRSEQRIITPAASDVMPGAVTLREEAWHKRIALGKPADDDAPDIIGYSSLPIQGVDIGPSMPSDGGSFSGAGASASYDVPSDSAATGMSDSGSTGGVD